MAYRPAPPTYAPTRARKLLLLVAAIIATLAACASDESSEGTDATTEGQTEAAQDGQKSWEPKYENGVLQPLPDGFPDQAITLMVADAASSPDGLYAQQLASAADEIAPVSVRAEAREDFPTFGNWEAMDQIRNSASGAEGYTGLVFVAPGAMVDLFQAPIEQQLGMTMRDIKPVIATEHMPFVFMQCTDVPWGDSMKDFARWTRQNPGEARIGSGGAGSGLDVAFHWYMQEENLDGGEVQMIPAAKGANALATAVASCEVDGMVMLPELAAQHSEAGRAEVLMVGRDEPVELWPDVPTAADLGMENDPSGKTREVVVPQQVPERHVKWLHELYRTAADSEEFKTQRGEVPAVTFDLMGPQQTADFNRATADEIESIIRDLGLHIDQQ